MKQRDYTMSPAVQLTAVNNTKVIRAYSGQLAYRTRPAALYYLDRTKEVLNGETGKGRPHSVYHASYRYSVPGQVVAYLEPASDFVPLGYNTYESPHWDHQYEKNGASIASGHPDAVFEPWSAIPGEGRFPSQFSIAESDIDEDSVVNDLYEAAQMQVADGLLNVVEADDLPKAVSSLARNILKYRSLVMTIGKKPLEARKTALLLVQHDVTVADAIRDCARSAAGRLLHRVTINVPRIAVSVSKTVTSSILKKAVKAKVLTQDIADCYLAYKFGIAPLYSDISKVHRAAKAVSKRAERFFNGKVVRTTRLIPYTVTCNVYSGTCFKSEGYNGWKYAGYDLIYTAAQATVLSNPNDIVVLNSVITQNSYTTSAFKAADAFMRKYASSPANLIWELTPFSFVVDWFVDIRGILRSVDDVLRRAPIQVLSLTRSRKFVAKISFHDKWNGADSARTLLRDGHLFDAEYRYYVRRVLKLPTMASSGSGFGKNQYGIAAALVSQVLLRKLPANSIHK